MSIDATTVGEEITQSHEPAPQSHVGDAGSFAGESSDSSAGLSMNGVTAASASAARARAQSMFHRVLANWASDVLRLQRAERLGLAWPAQASAA